MATKYGGCMGKILQIDLTTETERNSYPVALTPITARPLENNEYEVISGH
jgi:hypothetical protein